MVSAIAAFLTIVASCTPFLIHLFMNREAKNNTPEALAEVEHQKNEKAIIAPTTDDLNIRIDGLLRNLEARSNS